jgi:hypothetical protein
LTFSITKIILAFISLNCNPNRKDINMAKGLATAKPEPSGRFSTAPAWLLPGRFRSNDTASAVTAASYRYQARIRELEQRFEVELQGVRDAFLQELASLDLVEAQ